MAWNGLSRYAESPADLDARKEGYRSDYHRRHSLAIKAYMAGDSSLIDEFESRDPVVQSRRRGGPLGLPRSDKNRGIRN